MRTTLPLLLPLLLSLTVIFLSTVFGGPRAEVRPAAVAGQFYPSDPGRLKEAIRNFLDHAERPKVRQPLVLVVPHAGYVFSGQIAADAYRQIQGSSYDLVVILGTNHTTAGLGKAAVFARGAFNTPLGNVPVDDAVAAQLLKADRDYSDNPAPHRNEHSIEVQLPFLQQLLPGAKIVPIVIGSHDLPACARLGEILAEVIKDRKALIVASSDLSHYPPYEEARKIDRRTLEAIASMDPARLSAVTGAEETARVRGLATAACGEAPVLVAMNAAKALGARRGVIISYANSGDVAEGDKSRVVGYGAVAFTRDAAEEQKPVSNSSQAGADGTLQDEDKTILLGLARETLQSHFSHGTVPMPCHIAGRLAEKRGAFVTLRIGSRLRGCIGRMASDQALTQTISAVALQSALEDSRFAPLTADELPKVEIEISALTPSKPISGFQAIRLGRDGVVLRKGGRSAVFLPQVATEQHWNVEQLLTQLCRKAGLPDNAWRVQGTQLLTFQAEVFSESDFPSKPK